MLRTQWTEFHQTLVDDVVEATDELIGFRRSMGQDQGPKLVTVSVGAFYIPGHYRVMPGELKTRS